MDSSQWLSIVNEKCAENSKQTNEFYAKEIKNAIDEVAKIKTEIDGLSSMSEEYKSLTLEITSDLANSVYFASSGYYRVAFQSLRSALELGVSLIRFLDDKYTFSLWRSGHYDNSWSDLNCSDDSVYKYLKVCFNADTLELSDLKDKSKAIYRLCSEYVHGKYSYMQQLNTPRLEYDSDLFRCFIDSFNEVCKILLKIYKIRGVKDE